MSATGAEQQLSAHRAGGPGLSRRRRRSVVAPAASGRVPGAEALHLAVTVRVLEQLARWFGSTTGDWTHLRTDVVDRGRPSPLPPLRPRQRVALGGGVFVCGDHRDTASIQGAMFSGERTAAAVLRHLRG